MSNTKRKIDLKRRNGLYFLQYGKKIISDRCHHDKPLIALKRDLENMAIREFQDYVKGWNL